MKFYVFFQRRLTLCDVFSDIYRGEDALSEPEVKALANILAENKHLIRAYLTIHSYGGNILYPWGYKVKTYPPDIEDLVRTLIFSLVFFHNVRTPKIPEVR